MQPDRQGVGQRGPLQGCGVVDIRGERGAGAIDQGQPIAHRHEIETAGVDRIGEFNIDPVGGLKLEEPGRAVVVEQRVERVPRGLQVDQHGLAPDRRLGVEAGRWVDDPEPAHAARQGGGAVDPHQACRFGVGRRVDQVNPIADGGDGQRVAAAQGPHGLDLTGRGGLDGYAGAAHLVAGRDEHQDILFLRVLIDGPRSGAAIADARGDQRRIGLGAHDRGGDQQRDEERNQGTHGHVRGWARCRWVRLPALRRGRSPRGHGSPDAAGRAERPSDGYRGARAR